MVKGAFMVFSTAIIFAGSINSAFAGDIQIRGMTIAGASDVTQNNAFVVKSALHTLFDHCPAVDKYRPDIDTYGIFSNIDVFKWDDDSKEFYTYSKTTGLPSWHQELARKLGWHVGLQITIHLKRHSTTPLIKAAKKADAKNGSLINEIVFDLGGGKHPGIFIKSGYAPLCGAAHVYKVHFKGHKPAKSATLLGPPEKAHTELFVPAEDMVVVDDLR